MATIETVTGPIDAGDLGFTLIHEHLRCQDEAVVAQWPDRVTLSEEEPFAVQAGGEYDEAVKMAERALERNVKSIVDPTAMFLGRDVEFMRRVAEQTGLQVVPCTGIYTYDHLPQFFRNRSAEQIAEFFVADIEKGIQGTEHQGGVHQVRGRRAGPHGERRQGPPSGRDGERPDRSADHGPLPPGQRHGAEAGRHLRGGEGRPLARPDRPLRRHRTTSATSRG